MNLPRITTLVKPEPFEWLHQQQEMTAREGSPSRRAWTRLRQTTVATCIVNLVIFAFVVVTAQFPRNNDGSIQYRYYAPVLLFIGLAAGGALAKGMAKPRVFRIAAWLLVGFAILALLVGGLDAVERHAS